MEYRLLGDSGLKVSTLSFGNMTFGGESFFKGAGSTQLDEAKIFVDTCIDAGVNLFDTADAYSAGKAEEILGKAIGKKRDQVLIASKCHFRMGEGVNDLGQSRHHIIRACEASLKRLGTDYIDLYQVHTFDSLTALEHTMRALDDLVRDGKVRYIGCSNLPAWAIMKSLAVSDKRNLEKFVSLQAYYSLVARDLECEFVPLCKNEGLGILVWGPLSGGFLSGKYRRGQTSDPNSRRAQWGDYGTFDQELGFQIVDVLDQIAKERHVSISQVALNYLLKKPGITSLIIGARKIEQLKDNLQAVQWQLSDEELKRLDKVSQTTLPYPYWHHKQFNAERMPIPGETPVPYKRELLNSGAES
ncbi:MAG: aldo/keto reductase [Candidatus Obscuribacterales bacterium]|nr:aldo/keto reductase [Candidatus Obscuribacterales bacterium]